MEGRIRPKTLPISENFLYPNTFETPLAQTIYETRYRHPSDVNWTGTTKRVIGSVTGELYHTPKAPLEVTWIGDLQDRLADLMGHRRFIPGGRYLYAAGRDLHQCNNCLLLRAEDSREGWAELKYNAAMALMTGAGIGVWYGDVRPAGAEVKRTGGESSGPLPLMESINADGRCYIQGGKRRSAIWAGLSWSHKDVMRFIVSKDWSSAIKNIKAEEFAEGKDEFPAPMDRTNISVTLDDEFFEAYGDPRHPKSQIAQEVYWAAVTHMLKHGEPGFTIDVGENAGEVLRNACTEITSADDSDVCNLGSLVLPRFEDPLEFGAAARDALMFLTAGSLYSDVPYEKVKEVREQNRRLGLGIIGVHEFLMRRGAKYGSDYGFEILEPYMQEYGRALEYAAENQTRLGVSPSVGTTAVAPNGTIGLIAESTPSGDPLFSAAEIRRVVEASPTGNVTKQHVVVDPTAARLVASGVDPDVIEDAYSLAGVPERRLAMQAFLQKHTDHAISSTVNLPEPITDAAGIDDFGKTLYRYLPELRGVTAYPDGARAGQPRTPVDVKWALEHEGTIIEGNEETCIGGVCGA